MKIKNITTIVLGLVLVVLISALLAPVLAMFLDFKFRRILSRCIMIGTFLLIFYIIKKEKINAKDFFRSMGFTISRGQLIEYARGFFLCAVFISGIVLFQVIFGMRFKQYNMQALELVLNTLKIAGAAIIIGVIEEVFFRGIIYRSLKKSKIRFAFLISAFIYSIVHFFAKGNVFVDETPTVIDSFRVIGAFFKNFTDPLSILPAFIGLLFFGFVLNHAYYRSGTLLFPMGIHAGAVFCLKFSKSVSFIKDDASQLVYGSGLLYDGIIGWAFLILFWLFVLYGFTKREGIEHVGLFGEG